MISNNNNEQISKERLIEFKAGSDISELGFRLTNPYSIGYDSAMERIKTVDGLQVLASYSNGYTYLQSLEKYDFSNIEKVEIGTSYTADTTSGLLTFSVGLALDGTENTQFENNCKTSVEVQNKVRENANVTETENIVELDTSQIAGEYYLKILSQHSSSPSDMTMGAKVFWIKIYYNYKIPEFEVAYTDVGQNIGTVTVSNIKYKENIDKWKVYYKKSTENEWQITNNLSFNVENNINYNIKIVSGNIESREKKIISEKYVEISKINSWTSSATSVDTSYTAEKDCIVTGWVASYGSGTPTENTGINLLVNGVSIGHVYTSISGSVQSPVRVYLKQGDTIKIERDSGYYKGNINVYEIKNSPKFIDTSKKLDNISNVLSWSKKEGSIYATYEAHEDCVVAGWIAGDSSVTPNDNSGIEITINGIYSNRLNWSDPKTSLQYPIMFYLKKGDIFEIKLDKGDYKGNVNVYSVK